jgi:hypothetical protein
MYRTIPKHCSATAVNFVGFASGVNHEKGITVIDRTIVPIKIYGSRKIDMPKRFLIAISLLCIFITALTVQAFQSTQTVTVTARYLNVREAPSTSSRILAVVRAGQTYPVVGQSGSWWQIQVGDITGYVSGGYVKVNNNGAATAVPVVSTPAGTACPMTLFFSPTPLDICAGAVNTTQAAYQTYEHGFMIWLADSGDIWIFVDSGSRSPWLHLRQSDYAGFADNNLSAPSGRIQPINGFGRAWANFRGINQPKLKDNLGWATAGEVAYTATWQFFGRASVINTYISLPDGRVADAYNGMAGIFWSIVN